MERTEVGPEQEEEEAGGRKEREGWTFGGPTLPVQTLRQPSIQQDGQGRGLGEAQGEALEWG